MKKYLLVLIVAAIFLMPLACSNNQVWAGEVDVLINILVKKGILTPQEAGGILEDMQKESTRNTAAVKEVAKETAKETATKVAKKEAKIVDLPKWVGNTKLKGDVRLRFQKEDRNNNAGTDNRDRTRLRVRLGIETKVNDQWKAGIGLATGGNDPRSTNQTLQNTFDTPDIRLDYAYAQYKPFKWLSLVGGKFKNPFWKTKDLLWDGDIRPEGVTVHFKYKPLKNLDLWATPAYLILENIAGTADPNMVVLQVGAKWGIADNVYVKFAPSIYAFNQVRGNDFTAGGGWGRGTNSEDAAGNYMFDHDAVALDGEIGVELEGPVPFVAIFGQFVKSNADSSKAGVSSRYGKDDDTGYLAGFKFGHKKVKKLLQWQAKYNYRYLEADAWPDWMPDSDAYGGRTNIKGHEYELKLGLHKNVYLAFDYYQTKPIRTNAVGFGGGLPGQDEKVLQTDLVLKW